MISRCNVGTFAVTLNQAPAPATHGGDATKNPAFAPIHTYHLGMWFDPVEDAAKAGCPTFVTPFDGDHTGGRQVLSTRSFGKLNGALKKIDLD